MARIFWDSNIYIYLFKSSHPNSARVSRMLANIEVRGDELVTSSLTLGEVLTGTADTEMRSQWRLEIESTSLILDFRREDAAVFADIRRNTRLKAADSIQLAVASSVGIDLFLTADKDVAAVSRLPGVQFISLIDVAPI